MGSHQHGRTSASQGGSPSAERVRMYTASVVLESEFHPRPDLSSSSRLVKLESWQSVISTVMLAPSQITGISRFVPLACLARQ
jgi:hypothetical protein